MESELPAFEMLPEKFKSYRFKIKNIGRIHFCKGKLFFLKGLYEKAIEESRIALQYFRQTPRDSLFNFCPTFNTIGRSFMELGKMDSAAIYFHKAMSLRTSGFDSDDLGSNPNINSRFKRSSVITYAFNKGIALYKWHKQCPSNKKLLQNSYETFLFATQLSDLFRIRLLGLSSKQTISYFAQPAIQGLVSSFLDLQSSPYTKEVFAKAFHYSEQAKGISLFESRIKRALQTRIPKENVMVEEILRTDLAYQTQRRNQLINSNDPNKNAEIISRNEKIFFLADSLQKYQSKMTIEYPEIFETSMFTSPLDLKTIQKELIGENEALIEYFLGSDEIISFVITSSNYEIYRNKRPPRLSQIIETFLKSISDYSFIHDSVETSYVQYTESSHSLYQLLLSQILLDFPQICRLKIIPDGSLSSIPFESLLSAPPQDGLIDYASLPYLIRNYEISYGYSTRMLMEAKTRQKSKKTNSCLAFAPEYIASPSENNKGPLRALRNSPKPLLGARQEVQGIAELNIPGDFLFGKQATEGQFKALAPDYSLLHLAMHAQTSFNESHLSKFLFQPSTTDTCEDGFLYAYEISNLNLNADLAVLSACKSGVGKFQAGDGATSLSWAVMQSGVSSIVMTLWNVDDYSSSSLVHQFYTNLSNGYNSSEALHKAKLDFLSKSDSRLAHPYYWSSYVSMGSVRPFSKPQFSFYTRAFIIVLIFSLITLAHLALKKRKTNHGR